MAFFNWLIIVALILFYKPLFAKAEKPIIEENKISIIEEKNQYTGVLDIQGIAEITDDGKIGPTVPVPTEIITTDLVPTAENPVDVKVRLYSLSFYDPMIGVYFPDIALVNCADWDFVNKNCNSLMAGGEDFRDWYGKAVACPAPLKIGEVLRVIYPEELRGEWICKDRGGAIDGQWLDFLLSYPYDIWTGYDLDKFPWGSQVIVQLN